MGRVKMTVFTPGGSTAYLSGRIGYARRVGMVRTLEEAFMNHRPALLRYFRARAASDDAEDLLQDLWLKMSAAGWVEADDALAYLYRMAHNLMLDRRRAATRRRLREESYQDAIGHADDVPNAEHILLARESLNRVEAVLDSLGPKTSYVFRRHRVEGIAQRDIAAEVGVSLSAVEKHLQKAYRAVSAAQSDFWSSEIERTNRELKDERR